MSLQEWWKYHSWWEFHRWAIPDMKGHHIVMVVGVNLVCPIEPHISCFWGKTEGLCPTYSLLLQSKVFLHPGRMLFPRLHLLFNHESDCWSDQHYEAFVQSVKPNFPGDSWGYLRYMANFKKLNHNANGGYHKPRGIGKSMGFWWENVRVDNATSHVITQLTSFLTVLQLHANCPPQLRCVPLSLSGSKSANG